ncbi:hypothetical protein DFH09DRAFT_1092470 [Mycena vulgaris]|nr:hypothetical protein DFH09DRAFT_1092470 [Mycena vulgaris]
MRDATRSRTPGSRSDIRDHSQRQRSPFTSARGHTGRAQPMAGPQSGTITRAIRNEVYPPRSMEGSHARAHNEEDSPTPLPLFTPHRERRARAAHTSSDLHLHSRLHPHAPGRPHRTGHRQHVRQRRAGTTPGHSVISDSTPQTHPQRTLHAPVPRRASALVVSPFFIATSLCNVSDMAGGALTSTGILPLALLAGGRSRSASRRTSAGAPVGGGRNEARSRTGRDRDGIWTKRRREVHKEAEDGGWRAGGGSRKGEGPRRRKEGRVQMGARWRVGNRWRRERRRARGRKEAMDEDRRKGRQRRGGIRDAGRDWLEERVSEDDWWPREWRRDWARGGREESETRGMEETRFGMRKEDGGMRWEWGCDEERWATCKTGGRRDDCGEYSEEERERHGCEQRAAQMNGKRGERRWRIGGKKKGRRAEVYYSDQLRLRAQSFRGEEAAKRKQVCERERQNEKEDTVEYKSYVVVFAIGIRPGPSHSDFRFPLSEDSPTHAAAERALPTSTSLGITHRFCGSVLVLVSTLTRQLPQFSNLGDNPNSSKRQSTPPTRLMSQKRYAQLKVPLEEDKARGRKGFPVRLGLESFSPEVHSFSPATQTPHFLGHVAEHNLQAMPVQTPKISGVSGSNTETRSAPQNAPPFDSGSSHASSHSFFLARRAQPLPAKPQHSSHGLYGLQNPHTLLSGMQIGPNIFPKSEFPTEKTRPDRAPVQYSHLPTVRIRIHIRGNPFDSGSSRSYPSPDFLLLLAQPRVVQPQPVQIAVKSASQLIATLPKTWHEEVGRTLLFLSIDQGIKGMNHTTAHPHGHFQHTSNVVHEPGQSRTTTTPPRPPPPRRAAYNPAHCRVCALDAPATKGRARRRAVCARRIGRAFARGRRAGPSWKDDAQGLRGTAASCAKSPRGRAALRVNISSCGCGCGCGERRRDRGGAEGGQESDGRSGGGRGGLEKGWGEGEGEGQRARRCRRRRGEEVGERRQEGEDGGNAAGRGAQRRHRCSGAGWEHEDGRGSEEWRGPARMRGARGERR